MASKLTIFTVNHSNNRTNTILISIMASKLTIFTSTTPSEQPYSPQPLHQNKPCSVLMASKLTIFTANHSNRTNTILISITYTIFSSTTPSEQVQTIISVLMASKLTIFTPTEQIQPLPIQTPSEQYNHCQPLQPNGFHIHSQWPSNRTNTIHFHYLYHIHLNHSIRTINLQPPPTEQIQYCFITLPYSQTPPNGQYHIHQPLQQNKYNTVSITYTIFTQPLHQNKYKPCSVLMASKLTIFTANHPTEQIQYCFHYLYHIHLNHSIRTTQPLHQNKYKPCSVLMASKLTIFTVNHSNRTNTILFPLPIPYSPQPLHQNKYKPCSVLMASKLTIFTANHSNRTNTILISITYTIFSSTTPSEQVQTMFSLNGQKFAVTREDKIMLFHAPGKTREFNPFVLQRTFYGAYDETVCIDWTTDSRVLCVGSKDMNTRVYGAQHFKNLVVYSMGGHRDAIVGSFFEADSLDLYSISQCGHLCVYECDTDLDGLIPYKPTRTEEQEENKDKTDENTEGKVLYKRLAKHSFKDCRPEGSSYPRVTSVDYHKSTHILVTGFLDGSFFLHEMPDFNLIHSLNISEQSIASVRFNNTGDWIALACSGLGQLLVWEWQSETYVLKQQGHFNNMTCLAYSPDGQHLVTGGDDAKVKVWNTSSGFCFVTFNEHLGGVTGVIFTQNGQVVLTSSLDGTVRAFDLNRYRNFRTFTSPRPVQFSCITVDNSGDIVCAGGLDVFEIFVWSMQTGRLLEVLAGHEGPVSSLSFSPKQSLLASGSWDKSVKLWDVFENKGAKENIIVNSDVLAVVFRPDGEEIAVSTLDAQITFWNTQNVVQTGSLEGRHDLGYSRKEIDKITAKKSSFGK
ncbi:PWP2 [Mytilus edulis]|uniref:PWP2 n=1 Tax=Mytilus edulis TaxID=6550 RepID=A0A8S3QNU6_MYTED|nr:PWP2 [Mytilus edulis]